MLNFQEKSVGILNQGRTIIFGLMRFFNESLVIFVTVRKQRSLFLRQKCAQKLPKGIIKSNLIIANDETCNLTLKMGIENK